MTDKLDYGRGQTMHINILQEAAPQSAVEVWSKEADPPLRLLLKSEQIVGFVKKNPNHLI